jgi:hypothetical protein
MCAFSVFCDSIALHRYVCINDMHFLSFRNPPGVPPCLAHAHILWVDECVLVDVTPPDQVLRVNFIEFAMLRTMDAAEPSMAWKFGRRNPRQTNASAKGNGLCLN